MIETYNTVCPRNCYSTCSFKVVVENHRLIRIEPQPLNKATPEGPCLKGLSYIERVYSKSRIVQPLKKIAGKFIPTTWDDAITTISNRLLKFKNEYGSHSVFYYAASGTSGKLNDVSGNFWRLYGGVTTVYGNLCWPAGLEATRLTLGEVKHNVPWDIENSDLIVLWGKNPAETNVHQMVHVENAKLRGARLIVIDPRRTPSAESAEMLIQPKPGTDGILALIVAKIIIESGNHDIDFITRHVYGFKEYSESLADIDIKKASETCGVPVHMIESLAAEIGRSKRMSLIPGYGMQRYSNGGQTVRCLLSLSVITGNIGKPGAGWHYANLQSYILDSVKEPVSYYPDEKSDYPNRRSISTAKLGEQMLATKSPKLKMAWIERGNPVCQNPDSNLTLKALRDLEYVVVVELFMNDTAMEADLILPAKSMFEQSDIVGSYWNPYVQLKQKVIEPPEFVLPESEIYLKLARKLGYPEEEISEIIPDNDNIEKWLDNKLSGHEGITIEKLRKGPIIPKGTQEVAYEDMVFSTPSGKIELLSITALSLWNVNELPSYVEYPSINKSLLKSFPLQLMSPNTKNRIHSQFGNLNCIKAIDSVPYAIMSADDMASRGVNNGDDVRVFNDKGELIIKVKTDYNIRPGCVVIYNGYWNREGGSPNLLTSGRETDMGFGAAFHDNMVEVEKVR